MSISSSPRSRLSQERLDEIFGAVREMLLEVGYDRLTFDAIASRARTSKATLYRQWDGKPGIVLAALTQGEAHHPPLLGEVPPSTLDEAFARLAEVDHVTDRDLRMAIVLLNAAAADPEFGTALRSRIIAPVVDQLVAVFDAAAERGEIHSDSPLFERLAYQILTAFAFFPLLSGRPETAASRARMLRTTVRPALAFVAARND
jgi:AcrR family transcriptional regulator